MEIALIGIIGIVALAAAYYLGKKVGMDEGMAMAEDIATNPEMVHAEKDTIVNVCISSIEKIWVVPPTQKQMIRNDLRKRLDTI